MFATSSVRRRATWFGLATAAALAASVINAAPAAAAVPPVTQPDQSAVTADALPTAQINGVAWAQLVVGNTVYVGGKFTSARPAGSPAGSNETPRSNLLAYNLSTGTLISSFAPVLNAQVKSLALSPDGKTLYVGGQFTVVNGKPRNRIAAFDVATGALLLNFQPAPNYIVNAIVPIASTVYIGGEFTTVNGNARNRLAAFNAVNGALTAWAPAADSNVLAMVASPNNDRLIVGGQFQNLAGTPAYGLGAVSTTTGGPLSFAANNTVRDGGANAGITSLSTDGTSVYGTGFVYGAGGNLEGTFSANPYTGAITWVEDCHGDSYGSFPMGNTVYTVSHAHYCGPVGGFPQTGGTNSSQWTYHRTLAFTKAVNGTLGHNQYSGYTDWFGTPAPSLVNWFPDLTAGTYTGQYQAAWTVTGNSQYVILGGEFPTVNGAAQQGLVRFAVKSIAPDKQGPMVAWGNWKPTLTAAANGNVTVSFPANWDRDDTTLTYQVVRNSTTNVIYTTTLNSTFWDRPTITFTDTGAVRGKSNGYLLYATDSSGNRQAGQTVYVSVP